MKTILSQGVLLLLLCSTAVFAQNKSLGVGTPTPNANAALHVESPTNNQGMLIPRLTTAQRSSFTGALAAGDVGLIVFDTDLRSLAIWNGTAWDLGSKVGEPITATIAGSSGNAGTFTLTNATNNDVAINGTTAGTGHAAYMEITNPANSNAALFVGTNGSGNAITANGTIQASGFIGDGSGLTNLPSFGLPYTQAQSDGGTLFSVENTSTGAAASFSNSGTGVAGDFYIPNAASNNHAVLANTLGTGSAGFFRADNATSVSPAINATTTSATGMAAYFGNENISATTPVIQIDQAGTGNAITAIGTIQATNFVGDGSGLTNLPASGGWALGGNTSTTPGTDFIGTSDAQDVVFKANNAEAVRILSSGQVGIGSTPVSAKLDVSSANTTIGVHAASSAPSGVQNRGLQADASGSTAQNIGVYGTGFIDGSNGAIGVYGEAIGNGISDAYGLYGMTNNFTATTGKTFGVYASAENGSANWAGYFDKGNVHIKNALSVGLTDGTFGTAGEVLTSQGGSAAPAWLPLLPYTLNTSSGSALLDLNNSSGVTASLSANTAAHTLYVLNTGTGRAGMFNGSPSAEGVLTAQSGGNGAALSLFHLSNGAAIDIQQGGVRFASTINVSTAGAYGRAIVYNITAPSSSVITLTNPSANGDVIYVSWDGVAGSITFDGFVINPMPAETLRQLIKVGGAWKMVQ